MYESSLRSSDLAAEIERMRAPRFAPAAVPRAGARRFEAAVMDRLTSSWLSVNTAIDAELRLYLDRLRARSRHLFKNNEYAKKFGRMVQNGIVGPEGFTLQVRAKDANGKLDADANRAIESAFYQFMRRENCDVTGRQSFTQMMRGAALALARDGEFLFKKVRGLGKFGYQLQAINVDRLDTMYNVAPANGRNAVIMGVEVDAVLIERDCLAFPG